MSRFKPTRISRRGFAIATSAFVATASLVLPLAGMAETPDPSSWVINAAKARALLADGAILLDTLGQDLKEAQPVAGAAAVV